MVYLKIFIEAICILLFIGCPFSFFLAILVEPTDNDLMMFFVKLSIVCFLLYFVIYEVAITCGVPLFQ